MVTYQLENGGGFTANPKKLSKVAHFRASFGTTVLELFENGRKDLWIEQHRGNRFTIVELERANIKATEYKITFRKVCVGEYYIRLDESENQALIESYRD